MMHELTEPTNKDLRSFALIFGCGICLIFGLFLPWKFEYARPVWPWIVLACFAVPGLFFPKVLKVPYKLWMRFGMVLNAIMSRIILGIVYYLTVLPIGIIFRLRKKDPMLRNFCNDSDTYRVPSRKTPPDQMTKPF